jgi:hypothetical protein
MEMALCDDLEAAALTMTREEENELRRLATELEKEDC